MNGPVINMFGRLTIDPEQRYTRIDSTPYARVRLACNRYMGPDEEEETYYFSANLWRSNGEQVMRHCRKGDYIYVSGQYSQEEYTRRDGTTGLNHHVNVRDFQRFNFLSEGQRETGNEQGEGTAASQGDHAFEEDGSGLPEEEC